MPRRRSRPVSRADWPPPLRRIVHAAEAECPRGHAQALTELVALALRKVPARGILDPTVRGDHDLFTAIESVANAHLRFGHARSACRAALDAADLDLEARDAIERAALEAQSVSDSAYFYAGLAFGLVALSVYRSG
jgi:hypothetical protein